MTQTRQEIKNITDYTDMTWKLIFNYYKDKARNFIYYRLHRQDKKYFTDNTDKITNTYFTTQIRQELFYR